jgi:hypothetical protein
MCNKVNWLYRGKLEDKDDTEFLCEGISCWNCGHTWVFDPIEWREEHIWEVVGEDEEPSEDGTWTENQLEFIKTGNFNGHDFEYWIKELADIDIGKKTEEL